jgi:hypothetical protein
MCLTTYAKIRVLLVQAGMLNSELDLQIAATANVDKKAGGNPMIDRAAFTDLSEWLERPGRKPILLRGARQVLEEGLDEKLIIRITGLSRDEVEKLKQGGKPSPWGAHGCAPPPSAGDIPRNAPCAIGVTG